MSSAQIFTVLQLPHNRLLSEKPPYTLKLVNSVLSKTFPRNFILDRPALVPVFLESLPEILVVKEKYAETSSLSIAEMRNISAG